MVRCIVLFVIFCTLVFATDSSGDRKDAFYRCIASYDLPIFNQKEQKCELEAEADECLVCFCNGLTTFADYIENKNIPLHDIPFLNIRVGSESMFLEDTATQCISVFDKFYYENKYLPMGSNDSDWWYNLDWNQVYLIEACQMSAFRNKSHTTNGTFSFRLYLYLITLELELSPHFEDHSESAITQGFLDTCTTNVYRDDNETCVRKLIDSCFEFELYDPFLCFYFTISKFCNQFGGDQRLKCEVIVEERIFAEFEDMCTDDVNEQKCEKSFSAIIEKPLSELNSTDINQLVSIVGGGAKRVNYTTSSLNQLTTLVEYFSKNETGVSQLVDNADMNELYDVLDTLLNNERIEILANDNKTLGSQIITDMEEISRILSLAILNRNHRVSGNYKYDGNNLGFRFDIGRLGKNYSSENLTFNGTGSESELLSASVDIPSSQICPSDIDNLSSSADENEDLYYYFYNDICGNESYCEYNDYYYYDLLNLFDDCAKVLKVSEDCETIITTSVAQNVSEILSFGLPENMSFASLMLSVSISRPNSTSGQHSLSENATLHFTIQNSLMESIKNSVRCYFFDVIKKKWSDEGLYTRVNGNEVECVSSHLTSFAVLVDHQGIIDEIPKTERIALSVVGYIGPSISIVCLIISLAVMLVFRKQLLKTTLGYVHLNLCIALLLSLLTLVAALEPSKNIRWLCGVVAGLLHYLFLCVFCWMLAEGITLYIMVNHVWIKLKHWYFFFYLPFGWGLPLAIAGVSAGLQHNIYGANKLCWLPTDNGVIWAFLGPVILICLINMGVLIITVVQLTRITMKKAPLVHKTKRSVKTVKSAIVGVIFLTPLLGVTWIIGVFAIDKQTTIFLWLFTLSNSLQGAAFLFFQILQNHKVKSRICKCFKERKGKTENLTSSVRKFIKMSSGLDSEKAEGIGNQVTQPQTSTSSQPEIDV